MLYNCLISLFLKGANHGITNETLPYTLLYVLAMVAAVTTASWGTKGCINRERVQNFNNRINNKLELYKAANKKPVPLSVKYKFDLYRTIEAETGYWFSYDGLLTSQIQQKKLAELEKKFARKSQ